MNNNPNIFQVVESESDYDDNSDDDSDSSDSSDDSVVSTDCDELIFSSDYESSTDVSSSDDESSPACPLPTAPLIAEPPQVLEPYHHIETILGQRKDCYGFRICGDNIDKNIHTRYMRSDKRNTSLHYFHSYAVLNRIDVSALTDEIPETSNLDSKIVAHTLLPSPADDKTPWPNLCLEFLLSTWNTSSFPLMMSWTPT